MLRTSDSDKIYVGLRREGGDFKGWINDDNGDGGSPAKVAKMLPLNKQTVLIPELVKVRCNCNSFFVLISIDSLLNFPDPPDPSLPVEGVPAAPLRAAQDQDTHGRRQPAGGLQGVHKLQVCLCDTVALIK